MEGGGAGEGEERVEGGGGEAALGLLGERVTGALTLADTTLELSKMPHIQQRLTCYIAIPYTTGTLRSFPSRMPRNEATSCLTTSRIMIEGLLLE